MTKQVEDLTDLELKSIGYETLIALEQNKTNLQIIQTELNKRATITAQEVAPITPNVAVSKKK